MTIPLSKDQKDRILSTLGTPVTVDTDHREAFTRLMELDTRLAKCPDDATHNRLRQLITAKMSLVYTYLSPETAVGAINKMMDCLKAVETMTQTPVRYEVIGTTKEEALRLRLGFPHLGTQAA